MFLFVLFLYGCINDKYAMSGDVDQVSIDLDRDGFGEDDCDDNNELINPSMMEVCDGVDNNCNSLIDEGVADIFYLDFDLDGFGDNDEFIEACNAPEGYTPNGNDCDDSNALIFPGAPEQCDYLDNNCDGNIDENVNTIWYADSDEDGFGDFDSSVEDCVQPEGYTENAEDCNDDDETINPDAMEVCDYIDNDCDDEIDEEGPTTWYLDSDGDGFGTILNTIESCGAIEGYVADGNDCDDVDSNVHPAAEEVCDFIDNNCDGNIDDATAIDANWWYPDIDLDGFGDINSGILTCYQPASYISDGTDCDDGDAEQFPGSTEYCNGEDDNCDGVIDENTAVDTSTWYVDADADGYGDSGNSIQSCNQPIGYVASSNDCNDSNNSIYPNAVEYCNGADDDCDGSVDENAQGSQTYYVDSDGDGYGNSSSSTQSCSQPSGYSSNALDCNDSNGGAYPGATESCNGIDDDCDGSVDENGAINPPTWYVDSDGDGYGNSSSSTQSCSQPSGYSSNALDCNDSNNSIHPNAVEYCNGADDDCDGSVDENAQGGQIWYQDSDGDGFGNSSSSTQSCSQPSGYSSNALDCNDSNGGTYPGAPETCNLSDDDCDGGVDEGANCKTAFARFYKASTGEHFYTADLSEGYNNGFALESAAYFYLYNTQVSGTAPFYRCYHPTLGMHFYTTDVSCELWGPQTLEGWIGYIGVSYQTGTTNLYRGWSPSNHDHFYTTSLSEHNSSTSNGFYVSEGTAGFVWTSP